MVLHRFCHAVYARVDKTAYTEQNNSYNAYCKADTCVDAQFDMWHWFTVLDNVHGLYYKQVVVKRYHCIYKCYEHQYVEPCTEGTRKNEELAEESCKRGNAGK